MPVEFHECPDHPEGCCRTKNGLGCNRCGESGFHDVEGVLAHAKVAHPFLFQEKVNHD